MLTALVSLISGLVSGILPDLIKEMRESRQSARERVFIEEQHRREMERLKIQADAKINESDTLLAQAEVAATRDSLNAILEATSRPTGFVLIDAFNGMLRPAMVSGVMVLFFWVAVIYVDGVIGQYSAGKIDVATLNTAIWGSIVGEAIISVLGFLFGYRAARKVAGT